MRAFLNKILNEPPAERERRLRELARKREEEFLHAWRAADRAQREVGAAIAADASEAELRRLSGVYNESLQRLGEVSAHVPEHEQMRLLEPQAVDPPDMPEPTVADVQRHAEAALRIAKRRATLAPRIASDKARVDKAMYGHVSADFPALLDEQFELERLDDAMRIELGEQWDRYIRSKNRIDPDELSQLALGGSGDYSVLVTAATARSVPDELASDYLMDVIVPELVLCYRGGMTLEEAGLFRKKVAHVGPQELLARTDLDHAVEVKEELEVAGLRAKIVEGRPTNSGQSKRSAIPETVRHEVWRRDSRRCVDCGSRERLEFDHIIPISKGGSNTARNIELRCEACNRAKAARI